MLISNATVGAMETLAYKNNKGKMLKVVIRFGDGETVEATMFNDLAQSCALQPGDIIDLDGHWNKKDRFNNFDVLQYWHSTSTDTATPATHSGHAIETDPKLEYKFPETSTNGQGAPKTPAESQGSPKMTINERLIAEVDNTPLNAIKNPLKKEGIQSDNQGNGSFNGPLYGFNGGENIALDGDGTIDKANNDKASVALIQQYKNNSKIKFF